MNAPDPLPDPLADIEKSLTVPLSPDAAFTLFTEGFDSWWPKETHSIAAGMGEIPPKVEIEPRKGGHIIETLPDGSTTRWGTITDWRPGEALSFDWYVGRSRDEATEVTVAFSRHEIGTYVQLTHRGFRAAEARAGYHTGWDLVLVERFGAFCRAHAGQTTALG